MCGQVWGEVTGSGTVGLGELSGRKVRRFGIRSPSPTCVPLGQKLHFSGPSFPQWHAELALHGSGVLLWAPEACSKASKEPCDRVAPHSWAL